uniref:5'-nucleotidase domain-containing protein 1-like n=1 Tax=Ciona intestinalis TaxID=7719 RepID=UPI000180C3B3|nr:5'-nucleotidase domain-containing protein 1-like [Ciona intestinalis]|eukprot:XP_002127839.1 5'-nucleotidase domain-containing protein 1-like [Ciona intestinalis]
MISLKDCDAIGIDMDHTLCRYKLSEQIELGHQALAQYLIKEKKYPHSLADPVLDDPNLVYCGGLLFDEENMTYVKMDENGKVEKAAFGTKMLSESEISKMYPDNMKCSYFDDILSGKLSEKGSYHLHDNNFDLIRTVVHSRMMQTADSPTKKQVFDDLVAALAYIWDPKTSVIFENIKSNPEKYLHKCPNVVKSWLKALKKKEKVVFLLTSSRCDFVKHVMDYCLGNDWQSYFDVVISKAKKPGFFNEQLPFQLVDPNLVCVVDGKVSKLERNKWYSQGNSHLLHEHLKVWTGKESPKVVYFGDCVKSDIVPVKLHPNNPTSDWNAVYVMDALRGIEGAVNPLSEDEKRLLFSESFGPVLKSTDGAGMCKSFFCKLIEKYATIAVPSVEYVASRRIVYKYTRLGKGSGFYPDIPSNF